MGFCEGWGRLAFQVFKWGKRGVKRDVCKKKLSVFSPFVFVLFCVSAVSLQVFKTNKKGMKSKKN